MKPAANLWRSPMPYLFGSLALMLMIIAAALIILACSYCKDQCSRDEEGEKPRKSSSISGVEAEPKIVVIMAGDQKPRYLAKPAVVTLAACNCELV